MLGSLRASARQARLADGLERAVRAAEIRSETYSSVVPVQRAEVRATRALMLTLASRIRNIQHPGATALTRVRRLLTDGVGPLFAPAAPGTLREVLIQATVELEDRGPRSR